VLGPGDVVLTPEYTHFIRGTKNELLRNNDHIFIKKPQPFGVLSPFFMNNASTRVLELTGEFVGADIDRPVLRNQFARLPSIGVLYKYV